MLVNGIKGLEFVLGEHDRICGKIAVFLINQRLFKADQGLDLPFGFCKGFQILIQFAVFLPL